MSPQEQILIALQDLDLMLKEATDSQAAFERMGFAVGGIEELRKARTQLAGQLESAHLQHYERMSQRHGRAVSPVISDMCLACFAKIPTSYRSTLF